MCKTHGVRALCNLAACSVALASALQTASSSTPARGSPHRSSEQGGIHRSDSKSTVRRPHSQRLGKISPRWSPSTQRVRRSRPCTTRGGSRRLSKSARFPSLLSTSLELLTHGQCGGTNPVMTPMIKRRPCSSSRRRRSSRPSSSSAEARHKRARRRNPGY